MKINLVCVSKEYEIKTKMEPEQWLQLKIRLKNCFYWVITWKVVGQIKFWWMGWEGGGGVVSLLLWGNFSRCGGWANFWLVGCGTLPHFLQWEKTYIYIIYIYILYIFAYIYIYIYMYICIYRENPVFIGFSLCIYIYICNILYINI